MQKSIIALKEQERASWWIDNRDIKLSVILAELIKKFPVEQPPENKALEIDAQADATVRPKNPVTETVAEIRVTSNKVIVQFDEKRADFRQVVRFKGYNWNPDSYCWQRILNSKSGTQIDRAAELGHELLGNNFIIRIYHEVIRDKAINNTFIPEQTRWITLYTSGKESGRLSINWSKDEDFYPVVKLIKTARYVKPYLSVSVEQYEQVLDFASCNGFSISDAAQEAIDAARIIKENALTASVELMKNDKQGDNGKPVKLNVPELIEVDDELRD